MEKMNLFKKDIIRNLGIGYHPQMKKNIYYLYTIGGTVIFKHSENKAEAIQDALSWMKRNDKDRNFLSLK